MSIHDGTPKTLQDAILYFSDERRCADFLAAQRWPDGVVRCPVCSGGRVTYLTNQRRWKCRVKHPRQQFSIKVGTIFEDSPIPLSKWLVALWMLSNCKNGISSYEVGRALGVTQKSAWFMLHRIRLAMQDHGLKSLRGIVEADEAYIGGRQEFMHKHKRDAIREQGSQLTSKAIVLGILERGGRIKARVVPVINQKVVTDHVEWYVEKGSEVHTDSSLAYTQLRRNFVHSFVNHMHEYVRGSVHTNGIENFWSLLKRTLRGTYVSTEAFHLHRYVDEQAWRFNQRRMKDSGRFVYALRTIIKRRLTYKQLIGVATT
jgi:transposase-like protein